MISLKHITQGPDELEESTSNDEFTTIEASSSAPSTAAASASSSGNGLKRIRPNSQFLNRYINQQEKLNHKLIEVSLSSASENQTTSEDIDLILFRKKGESEMKRMAQYYGFDISLTLKGQASYLPDGYLLETGRLQELQQRQQQQKSRNENSNQTIQTPQITALSSSSSSSPTNVSTPNGSISKKRKDIPSLTSTSSSSSTSSSFPSSLVSMPVSYHENVIVATSIPNDNTTTTQDTTQRPIKMKRTATSDHAIVSSSDVTITSDGKDTKGIISTSLIAAPASLPVSKQLQSIKSILNTSSSSSSSARNSKPKSQRMQSITNTSITATPLISDDTTSSSSATIKTAADKYISQTTSVTGPSYNTVPSSSPLNSSSMTTVTPASVNTTAVKVSTSNNNSQLLRRAFRAIQPNSATTSTTANTNQNK